MGRALNMSSSTKILRIDNSAWTSTSESSLFRLSWLRIPFHSWMCGLKLTKRIPTTTLHHHNSAQAVPAVPTVHAPVPGRVPSPWPAGSGMETRTGGAAAWYGAVFTPPLAATSRFCHRFPAMALGAGAYLASTSTSSTCTANKGGRGEENRAPSRPRVRDVWKHSSMEEIQYARTCHPRNRPCVAAEWDHQQRGAPWSTPPF